MATAQERRDSDYITRARQYDRELWNALNNLLEMQAQWNSLDYGTTLEPGVSENEGITGPMVGAVVFATADAMKALLASGHGTNMAALL